MSLGAPVPRPGCHRADWLAAVLVLVGGLGTLWGPMFGAMLLGALKGFLGSQQWIDNGVVMGLLMVAVVLFLPSGLLPSVLRGFHHLRTGRQRRAMVEVKHEA